MYMKKILFLFVFLLTLNVAKADTFDVTAAYVGSSYFDKAQVNALAALSLNITAGLEAKWANEHHTFKDPVYSVAVPVALDFDLMRFEFRPFYYFNNKSDQAVFQDSSAFGIQSKLVLTINEDTANDLYTHAFIGVSFARQKGTVFYDTLPMDNRYYSQMAYTLGLKQDFYQAFSFRITGAAFQYPDGITGITGVRSILDQQELADLQTLDIVHDLTKYTVAGTLSRMWSDNGSSFYVGYRFGEFYTADNEHSILVGNSFPATKQVSLGFAYNHVRTTHNTNKRDIWRARVEVIF